MSDAGANGVLAEEEPSSYGGRYANGSPTWKSNGAAAWIEPLRPENVRWFYKSDSKRWTKFDGFDSLSIEYRYRVNFGNEAELSCLNGKYDSLAGVYTVVVRGGLYEVDLLKRKCTSIFWPGEYLWPTYLLPVISCRNCSWYVFWTGEENDIFRGVWFYDGYEPYKYGEDVETEHLNLFQDGFKRIESNEDNGKSGICVFAILPTVELVPSCQKFPCWTYFFLLFTVLRDVTFEDMHVVWYSPTEVYSFKQKTFINTKIMRSVTKKLGSYFQKCKLL